MNITKHGISVGVIISLILVCTFCSMGFAAPPKKDVCPAPESQTARRTAVETACGYFDMTTKSWGMHSAFGPSGEVITCLHFSCRETPPSLREDCLSLKPNNLKIKSDGGRWLLTDGRSRIKMFDNRSEADLALKTIRHYGINKQCFVGRPNPSMEYWLVGNNAPSGRLSKEDCLSFDPVRLQIRQDGRQWLMTDGRSRMRMFPNREEAEQAVAIIRNYGFNQTCYIGRPGPSVTYFRK